MVVTAFAFLAAIIPFVTVGLLLAFWLVARSRFPVGALPWIILYLLIQPAVAAFSRGHGEFLSETVSKMPHENAYLIAWFAIWLIFTGVPPGLLLALLALSNAAVLLPGECKENRFLYFFAAIYSHRVWIGVLLLMVPILNWVSVWWMVGLYHSP